MKEIIIGLLVMLFFIFILHLIGSIGCRLLSKRLLSKKGIKGIKFPMSCFAGFIICGMVAVPILFVIVIWSIVKGIGTFILGLL